MKVMTVLGTRPEIIRLSRVIPLLDAYADHILVHTGQNFTPTLSDVFFEELSVRAPDIHLGVETTSFGQQIGDILTRIEQVFSEVRPDRLLILGDTNSALVAIIAKRMGIPVYHMEAGNRCFDDRVPEEVNRRIIDHSSTVLLPYTNRAKANLVREGIEENRIHVTGNPIGQVLEHYRNDIDASDVLERLGLDHSGYFLVTVHRSENVDDPERLESLIVAWSQLHQRHSVPVVVSVHPRTAAMAQRHGNVLAREGVRFLEPFGFLDFVRLEKSARCILTDSGTVQEEACILGIPSVTTRSTTERPETRDVGSNILADVDPQWIMDAVDLVLGTSTSWTVPDEYRSELVAETVVRLVLGYREPV